jgi:hypothetical protein
MQRGAGLRIDHELADLDPPSDERAEAEGVDRLAVRGQQQEASRREESIDVIEQGRQVAVDAPCPTRCPVAVRRWVEDDAVVSPPPPDFAGDERGGVIDEPPDRPIVERVARRISTRPLDRRPGRVDMCYGSAGARERQRHEPGIREKVEHGWAIAVLGDAVSEPRQMDPVLGIQPDLAGIRRAALELHVVDPDRPASLCLCEALAGPALTALEPQVSLVPSIRGVPAVINAGVRSVDQVIAEPLEPPSLAGIDRLIALHEVIFTGNRASGGVESDKRERRRFTCFDVRSLR